MQPTLVDAPPEGDGWLHEIKYDGYRTQLAIGGGEGRAFTRNGFDWSAKYGPLIDAARALNCRSALIEGEVAVQNDAGVTDFGALPAAIKSDPQRLIFFAFDLLHLDGQDIRSAPIEERRAKLRWLLEGAAPKLHMSDEYAGDGRAFFELVDRLGLEGVVSKKKGSRYVSGDTKTWLKAKCWHTATFEVIGVERDSRGVPYALLAVDGIYKGAAFITLPNALRDVFWRYVEGQGIAVAPIAGTGKKKATWIAPGLRATVRHLKGSDKLRHATVTQIEVVR